ncbi:MAG: RNA methyltransferase [Chloroflexota bacterium]
MKRSVSSPSNPRIKQIAKLKQRRQRDSAQETVVEGERESYLALRNGFVPKEVFICLEIMGKIKSEQFLQFLDQYQTAIEIIQITPEVFAKIAYRETTGGLVLTMPYWASPLAELSVTKRPFFAVIENVEKPGNLGAILRTTDAVGVDGVIICTDTASPSFDLYNPNVIRSSLGAVFTQPIAVTTTTEFINWADQHDIAIVAATPDASKTYDTIPFTEAVAIATGSEAAGLTEKMISSASETAVIPMHGQVDSLNLSVSTALLLYEAHRQRKTKNRQIEDYS